MNLADTSFLLVSSNCSQCSVGQIGTICEGYNGLHGMPHKGCPCLPSYLFHALYVMQHSSALREHLGAWEEIEGNCTV